MRILLFLAILASGCSKKENQAPIGDSVKQLKIVWQKAIIEDSTSSYYTLALNPLLYKGQVIFGTGEVFNQLISPVMFLDTSTGKILDLWSDYGHGTSFYYGENTSSDGDFLCLSTQRSIDCLNLDTKGRQWTVSIANNGPRIYTHNGSLFTSYESFDGKTAFITRSPVSQKDFKIIFSLTSNDASLPYFGSFGFGNLPNGDDVIAWTNRPGNNSPRTEIFAYNLTADSLLWVETEIKESSGISPLQIQDNRVYGLVNKHAFCIDLISGNTIWYQKIASLTPEEYGIGFNGSDFLLHNNSMIIKGNHQKLLFLKKSDGSLMHSAENLPAGIKDRMVYFEGKLFFAANGALVIADANTGEQLLSDSEAKQFDNILSKILIDPDRRVMYFHDGRYAYCVKIPNKL